MDTFNAPLKKPLGVLIIHGFMSSLDAVRAVTPVAERLNLPYRMPVLRGHGTRPEDLRGVTRFDWYADAEAALLDLRREVDRVVVCGLSMGGLVALELAVYHPDDLAGVIAIAPALRIASPLIHFGEIIARLTPMWTPPPGRGYADQSLATKSTNYKRFATDAALSLHRYGQVMAELLPRVKAPLLILHARNDRVIKPLSAKLIYEQAGSREKELVWFDHCNHEMLLDCESVAVLAAIERYLRKMKARASEANGAVPA
jgi:carboxylesterase